MKHKHILMLLGLLLVFSFAGLAEAATIFASPSNLDAGVGDEIIMDIKIDSEGAGFNAGQAVIRFPKETLEVVSLKKDGSAFSFWLEEPNFSNNEGIVSFIGGTPYGVSGSSIQILKIVFKTRGSGQAELLLPEAAITASDGSGTNILSKISGALISVLPEISRPAVPEPRQITRTPAAAAGLPAKPEISVPLYPDLSRWYNISDIFTARWDLPPDVSGVSTALNTQPNYAPTAVSEGLFEEKTFESLSDGVSYFHIRFRNNIGWGPVSHYRLAVDTRPPAGFEAVSLEGLFTDNPSPTLNFQTTDALSGIAEYQIRIGVGDLIRIPADGFNGVFKLPLQAPGKRQVVIRAVDAAGNGVENGLTLEILPIDSPVIAFITSEVFSDDEIPLAINGTAPANLDVLLSVRRLLRNDKYEITAQKVVRSDERGRWEGTFDAPPKNGDYVAIAQSRDDRGALSLEVASDEIKVRSKPIISIGFISLGKGGTALLLLLVLIVGFGGGTWFYKKRENKLALRVVFMQSEITKIFGLIMEDIEALDVARRTPTPVDDEHILNNLKEKIKKMESYAKRGIEKIKK
ncbi:MAG: hypothetical protein HYY55_00890 [Candidatus Niyogibacteria bacterium]|nr:MAG: hypothetical protein HYY55_00890 [Candidatus Niyogibacteria bacterium]